MKLNISFRNRRAVEKVDRYLRGKVNWRAAEKLEVKNLKRKYKTKALS